jgi:hypothetical protein
MYPFLSFRSSFFFSFDLHTFLLHITTDLEKQPNEPIDDAEQERLLSKHLGRPLTADPDSVPEPWVTQDASASRHPTGRPGAAASGASGAVAAVPALAIPASRNPLSARSAHSEAPSASLTPSAPSIHSADQGAPTSVRSAGAMSPWAAATGPTAPQGLSRPQGPATCEKEADRSYENAGGL